MEVLDRIIQTCRTSPLMWLVGFGFCIVCTHILYSVFLHPLRKVPGPFPAQFTELWRSTRYFQGTWHTDILTLHRQYGPVVRVAPNEVSVVSPDLVKTVYSHQKGSIKTDWYDTWKALGGRKSQNTANSFFGSTDPKEHAFLRKRVSGLYSMSSVMSMEQEVQTVLGSLWERFDMFAETGEAINLSLWASYFTYDVVGTLCLSQTMGFVREGKDVSGFISNIHGAFYWVANLGYLPGQSSWIAHPITSFLAPLFKLRIADYARAFQRLSVDKVFSRMKEGPRKSEKQDMLDHFLAMKDPEGNPASISAIMAEIGNVLAAGADTTSVAIKAVLGPLLQDSARYRRLQAELDEALNNCGLANEPVRNLPYAALKDLPFLSACIKEGSRVHPSIVYQLPRKAPMEGLHLEGYFLGPSTTISMSPLAQNRCKSIFGDDADEWKPERWIHSEGNSEEQIKLMDKNLATFGYGSRTCIGRNLAAFEVCKFVGQFLTHYDVELANPECPWAIKSLWFAELGNMIIRLKKRRHD